jgi:hypothetical protein
VERGDRRVIHGDPPVVVPSPKTTPLGAAFRPATDESKPLGTAFVEGPRAKIPPVVVIHPLGVFRAVLERHGWPKEVDDPNAAQDAALLLGTLDISEVERVYGVGEWQRAKFVILPPVEGEEDAPGVFRALKDEGVVRLLPPAG